MLKAQIIGSLGADASRVNVENNSFVSFNVAHTRKYTSRGVKNEETYWVSVIVNWDATNLLPYLLKGVKVFVSGNLKTRVYVGHDGKQHAGLTIVADTLELCSSRLPKDQQPTEQPNNEPPF